MDAVFFTPDRLAEGGQVKPPVWGKKRSVGREQFRSEFHPIQKRFGDRIETNMRFQTGLTFFLIVLLAGCASASSGMATAVAGTAGVGTAVVVTPFAGTPPPLPTAAPPTPIPTLPSGASPAALKYLVLMRFPGFFYCDPDFYPIGRGDELERAIARFPEIQANPEEFRAIVNHLGLSGQSTFTDEQKLLIYREYKKLAAIPFELVGNHYQFQIEIQNSNRQGFLIKGQIDGSGSISIESQQPSIATCPICLAADTQIDTPLGPKAVDELRVGDPVWTTDAQGIRRQGTILEMVSVLVPANHQMAHLKLQDGRELWASPGHPTADGRRLGDLKPGDVLDGSAIASIELVPYDQTATYDLLPSGATGTYWANGILIGSTLFAN
jgi:hypothetical protein